MPRSKFDVVMNLETCFYCSMILDGSFLGLHVQQICWLTRSFEQWVKFTPHQSNSICSGASTPLCAVKAMGRFPETLRCWTAKVVGVGNEHRQRMDAFAGRHRGESLYNGLSSPIGHKTLKNHCNIHWKARKHHKTTGQEDTTSHEKSCFVI